MEVDDRTLFIGNIDKNVSEEILYELFLQAGPVEKVSIPNSRSDSFHYGFVTYKHECSVDYAIELFKGTSLFRKELFIKKKYSKNSNQEANDFKFSPKDSVRQGNDNFKDQLHDLQLLAKNLNHNSEHILNMASDSIRGNWLNRSRPYSLGMKNHFSRPSRGNRDRPKGRDYFSKMYCRNKSKNRHRD